MMPTVVVVAAVALQLAAHNHGNDDCGWWSCMYAIADTPSWIPMILTDRCKATASLLVVQYYTRSEEMRC